MQAACRISKFSFIYSPHLISHTTFYTRPHLTYIKNQIASFAKTAQILQISPPNFSRSYSNTQHLFYFFSRKEFCGQPPAPYSTKSTIAFFIFSRAPICGLTDYSKMPGRDSAGKWKYFKLKRFIGLKRIINQLVIGVDSLTILCLPCLLCLRWSYWLSVSLLIALLLCVLCCVG